MLVGHQRIGHRHPFDVPGQNLRPLGIYLVAKEEPLPCHPSGDLGGLAAGSGTEVADLFTGLGIQQSHGGHGTGLL